MLLRVQRSQSADSAGQIVQRDSDGVRVHEEILEGNRTVSGKSQSNQVLVGAGPVVVLKRGEEDRIIAGHPWVYAGAVQRVSPEAADGCAVRVLDHRRRFLGVGFYNSRSKINVRVLAHDEVQIDKGFFVNRIHEALGLRERYMPWASSFRVVNAEGDFLSGLIVDKYDDVLVIQTSALGMDQRQETIVEALRSILSPRAVIARNDIATRKLEGLQETRGVLWGSNPGEISVTLNKLHFAVDLLSGHKTGLYLDQQVNYALVADLVAKRPGARVLDCFCFTGGFGLHATAAGASHVHFIDQSEEAITLARRHAELNGLTDRCSFEAANVFDWFKAHAPQTGRESDSSSAAPQGQYDVIVLDPPSFTRNRASVPDALRGYKEIHLRAFRLLAAGGLLATFCCSHHVDARTFLDVILSAAFDTRRVVRRVATFTQAPDHPIIPSIPETEYLKGYAVELVR